VHCHRLFALAQPHLASLDAQGLATAAWMCARVHYLPPQEQRQEWERCMWERRGEVNLIETSNTFFRWVGGLGWVGE